jgi:hypothetical protein
VTRFRRSIDPSRAPWPPWTACGVYELASETALEECSVVAVCEAEDDHVDTIATKRMATRADHEALAELANDRVVAALAVLSRQHD